MIRFFIYMAIVVCIGMIIDLVIFREKENVIESVLAWGSTGVVIYIMESHFIIEVFVAACVALIVRLACQKFRKQN